MTIAGSRAVDELSLVRDVVMARAHEAVKATCQPWPRLRDTITVLLDEDESGLNIFRLLPHAFIGNKSEDAHLVGTVSRIWWTGAETLDDLIDGKAADHHGPAAALIASTACITLIPELVVRAEVQDITLRELLTAELLSTSLHSADGQIEDVGVLHSEEPWRTAMHAYAGKNGAAYGRDLVLTAILRREPPHRLQVWRRFGKLFGVLRQMVNDRAGLCTPDNEDFINGTRTLMLASAASVTDLTGLHARARTSVQARRELLALLFSAPVADVYNGKVHALRYKLLGLLEHLAPAPDRAALVRSLVDASTGAALMSAEVFR
ncbi:hypothetical protein SAMN04488564_1238 [Lentzea waywayandensis]|uniref:Geranylgeranyl pyrophosphate synthase n=1 Tax=Lentzea waywayandensis TaxID=84724 RepID=A0A1I6FIW1_9PSEU|nr:hypothetical protein [Lentzea waywayandensis]SFR29893.1 hypothetical protein SAMN04488564_1238 [Lentzea waywayandensis]